MVREETDKTASNIEARLFVAGNLERHVKELQAEREAKLGNREPEARQCQKAERYLLQ